MGKLEDRENRRRASVVGAISGLERDDAAVKRGRPRKERETKKRVSLSVLPSLYEDIQRIAYVERRSTSELIAELMEHYREEHQAELSEFHNISQ